MVAAVNRCTPIHHSNKSACKVGRYLDSFFEYRGRSYKIISIKNNQLQVSRDDHALSSSQIAWRVFLTVTIVVLCIAAIYKIGRLIQLSKYSISLYEPGNEALNIIEENNNSKKKINPETIEKTSTVFPQKIEGKKSNASTEILSSVDADSHSHHTVENTSSSTPLDVDSVMDFSSMRVFDANAFKGPADRDKFQELVKIWKKLDLILLPSLHQMDDAFLRDLAGYASQNIELACIICKTFNEQLDEAAHGEKFNFATRNMLQKQFGVFLQSWINHKSNIDNTYPKRKVSDDKRCELQNLLFKTITKHDRVIQTIKNEEFNDALLPFLFEQNENPAQLLDLFCWAKSNRDHRITQYDMIMQNLTDKQLEIIAKGLCTEPEGCYYIRISEKEVLRNLLEWLDYHIVRKTTELQIFEYIRKAKKMLPPSALENAVSSNELFQEYCNWIADSSSWIEDACRDSLHQYFSKYEMLQLGKHGEIEPVLSAFKEFKKRFDELSPDEKFPAETAIYVNLKQQYETFLASWLVSNGPKSDMSNVQRQELQELAWNIFQEHNCLVKNEFKTAYFAFMFEWNENPEHLQDLYKWLFVIAKDDTGMDYIKIFMQNATDEQLQIIAENFYSELPNFKSRLIDFVSLMDYCIINAEKQEIAKPQIFEYFKKVKRMLPSFELSNIFRPDGQFQDSLAVFLKNIFPKKLHDYLSEYELCIMEGSQGVPP